MNDYTNKAMQMAKGGVVKMQTGGTTPVSSDGPLVSHKKQLIKSI